LLALRIFLIVAICLALARPKLFDIGGFSFSDNRPVAAVFLFDTSPSMAYTTSDQATRLEDAQKRGLELLAELPEGSKIAILDTSDLPTPKESGQSVRGRHWALTREEARERIQALKVAPGGVSITHRLDGAYRLLADLALNKSEPEAAKLPRLLVVFSDRTRAAWDSGRMPNLHEVSDQVSPLLEGLQQARGNIPNLQSLLKELRQQMPPAEGRDYPEQPLLDSLDKLVDWIPGLGPDDMPPNPDLSKVITTVRRQTREVLKSLPTEDEAPKAKEYRGRLVRALHGNLAELGGVLPLFIDVGVDKPIDLAIVDLELPANFDGGRRQVFGADEKFDIVAHVQAIGKDYDDMTLTLKVDKGKQQTRPVAVKANERASVRFQLDANELKLQPGPHQVEVRLNQKADQLPFDDVRFLTFAVREPRKVLVLADNQERAGELMKTFETIEKFFGYHADLHMPSDRPNLGGYKAVFLLSLSKPDETLWKDLYAFAKEGHGVCIIPPDKADDLPSYNKGPAQDVMPAVLTTLRSAGDPGRSEGGLTWKFAEANIYQHPIFAPFKKWRNLGIEDRQTFQFWQLTDLKKSQVLVNYKEPAKKNETPALVERRVGKEGKVVLFTTLLDYTTPTIWNNFAQNYAYLVFVTEATKYLAGNPDNVNLNVLSGEMVMVDIPGAPRYPEYVLRRDGAYDKFPVGEQQTSVPTRQTVPGNYVVEGGGKVLAGFSVNLPADESNLARVPPEEIQALMGLDAVVPIDRRANIRDALQGHWSQPIELFPFLMILLLLVLAVENLLSNKFYRREPGEEENKEPASAGL
jgi:hypothetical protein